jgi:DNA-binding XRE family transcriptional regulator
VNLLRELVRRLLAWTARPATLTLPFSIRINPADVPRGIVGAVL